jgi:hypothetical protein
VVYEIGASQYAPILQAHPELVDVLAKLMVDRLRERHRRLDAREAERNHATIARQIRGALFPHKREPGSRSEGGMRGD